MDERGRFMWSHVEFFENNVVTLQHEITKWMQANIASNNQISAFGKIMENIGAQEPFQPLRAAMHHMAEGSKQLNDQTNEVMCERPDKQLLGMLAVIQKQAIAPIKKLLKDRESAIKLEHKLQKDYEISMNNNPSSNIAAKKMRLLSDQKRRVDNVNVLVDYHMQKLEQFRVIRLKKILQEIAWSQMFYHCRALEILPETSKMTSLVDERDAIQNLGVHIQMLEE